MRMKWGSPLTTGAPLETSAWDCVSEAKTYNAGFRLVHEDGYYAGVANGNLWFSLQEHAGSMYRQFHQPGGSSQTAGFRLVWDRRET